MIINFYSGQNETHQVHQATENCLTYKLALVVGFQYRIANTSDQFGKQPMATLMYQFLLHQGGRGPGPIQIQQGLRMSRDPLCTANIISASQFFYILLHASQTEPLAQAAQPLLHFQVSSGYVVVHLLQDSCPQFLGKDGQPVAVKTINSPPTVLQQPFAQSQGIPLTPVYFFGKIYSQDYLRGWSHMKPWLIHSMTGYISWFSKCSFPGFYPEIFNYSTAVQHYLPRPFFFLLQC